MYTCKDTHTHSILPFCFTTLCEPQRSTPAPQPHPVLHTALPLNLINRLFPNVPMARMETPERPQAQPRRSCHPGQARARHRHP